MKTHPVAALFPMISQAELQELAEDIKANGLQQAITMLGDVLLDGRNRLKACELAGVEPRFTQYIGDSPVAFIVSANLKRRELTISQKIAIALEIEPHFAEEARRRMSAGGGPGRYKDVGVGDCPTPLAKSRDQAAAAVGVSGKTVSTAKAIRQKSPELFEKLKAGKVTLNRAKKELKAKEDRQALADAQQKITEQKREQLASVCDLRVCSCRELFASGIKPDAVITDPPYPEEFLSVFSELAEACRSVPLVAVMVGQLYLPEVIRRLCEHLKYRWTIAYLLPGGQSARVWPVKVNPFWKPVLLFGEAVEWFGDVATSDTNDNDKRYHGWGQSESGFADLVERLTKPGQLICDPFLGAGTTAVAALALGRRFVGCDIDGEAVETARQRIEAMDIRAA